MEFAPCHTPPAPVQSPWVMSGKHSVPRQHAPLGNGQVMLPQEVAFPWNTPPCAWHCEGLRLPAHEPEGRQQAPIGKHTKVLQLVPMPAKTLGALQLF